MAVSFVRVSTDLIDAEVNAWLKRVAERFDLDRSTIAEYDVTTGVASFSHGWARQADQFLGPWVSVNMTIPWLVTTVSTGQAVVFSRVEELPPEASVDIAKLGRLMPASNVTVPIKFGGKVVGGIGFATIGRQRMWTTNTVAQLQAIAEVLGSALGRKRNELEISRLREDLTFLSRVNSMGELAAALAHELNQPLMAILANAQAIQSMIESGNPDPGEITEALGDIVLDDERATAIIRQLRSMLRHQEPEKVPLNPDDMVRQVARLLEHDAAMRGIRFSINMQPPLPLIYGDRTQLQQVIINLVMNAFDAVSSVATGLREVQLGVSVESPNRVRITVSDNGVGIPPENIDRIFKPFFTTKPQGIGIGLSLSRSIVEGHQGRISVAPNLDRGVTFEIALPIHRLLETFASAAKRAIPVSGDVSENNRDC
jgi:signal transduction histidine kinase